MTVLDNDDDVDDDENSGWSSDDSGAILQAFRITVQDTFVKDYPANSHVRLFQKETSKSSHSFVNLEEELLDEESGPVDIGATTPIRPAAEETNLGKGEEEKNLGNGDNIQDTKGLQRVQHGAEDTST